MRRLSFIVEKLHRLGVIVKILEEVGEKCLIVSEDFYVLIVKVDPNLDSVEGLKRFGRDEAETIDSFGVVKVLPEEEEDKISVDFVFVVLSPTD